MYGIAVSWFRSYLHGHTQSDCFQNASGKRLISGPLPNSMGVFRCSVLGPLLFTMFGNDMGLFSSDITVCFLQYADDTQLLVSGAKKNLPDVISQLDSALVSLDQWLRANALTVNTTKTQIIAFGFRQNMRNIKRI